MTRTDKRFLRYGLLGFIIFFALAILDGIIREAILVHLFGSGPALTVSGLIMLVVLYVVLYIFLKRVGKPDASSTLWLLGAMWVVLTVAAEFVLSVWVLGEPIAKFASAYSIASLLQGNLILVGLLGMFIGPWVVARQV